ncbi:glycoside hydrolase family 61 protein [Hypoxylon fragiforme]|uniref:glycoside hydrolase family 61 protein n=1 Tax=Hypoxylon fragiforme TaxID=63214 RepID=UPI0020C64163|nr:glycoside hydrolase family 61 protein [Hypoxylon fragiforme]KAI2605120.1 glycoside hydrolase family 61 protein [Hypoxylon fragiforme]
MFPSLLPLLLLAPSLAAAHGAVTSYEIGGKAYEGYQGFSPVAGAQTIQRQWKDYNPIMTVTDALMTCNGGTSAPVSAEVAAGANVTAVWKQWTHQQGPVMVWLYPCDGAFASCDGKAKKWFKIDEMGLTGDVLNSNNWGTAVIYKDLKWSSRIPESLKPGNYLIRHELLALHQANTPQFYPECAQITVTGSGTATPPVDLLTSIPAYAAQSDPGIMVDIYQGKGTSYKTPGPAVWTG